MTERKSFVDTNIWFYAFTNQAVNFRQKAEELIESNKAIICLSNQVINELSANLIKKAAFKETGIKSLIARLYFDYYVVDLNEEILLHASDLRSQYPFSFWDGLIVASALFANAETLYSEDIHNGLMVENRLKIVNPFIN